MKITWIGHSCFLIEKDGYVIVTDPYQDDTVPGLSEVRETADLVLCSHDHFDHCAKETITLREGKASPFKITSFATWHDEVKGEKRGPNTIYLIDDGETTLAHFGDLGCELTKEQAEALSGLDIALIPVGGFFTIDGAQAKELVKEIRPKTVIPMHFRNDKNGTGFDKIGPAEDFTDGLEGVVYTEESTAVTENGLPPVLVLTPRNLKKA